MLRKFPRVPALSCVLFLVLAHTLGSPASVQAQVSIATSYFVPQTGPPLTPTTGIAAIRLFRGCPNNDGGSSFPNRARIKIVLLDSFGAAVNGLVPYIKVNGGTAAQGFGGTAADSVIANNVWNVTPPCSNLDRMDTVAPLYRYIDADGPTVGGVAYLTFIGADGVRDADRKWGHYDCKLPVYVLDGGVEKEVLGKLLETDPQTLIMDTTCGAAMSTYGYVLRIKSLDWAGGLGAFMNQGELVNVLDYNGIANGIGIDNVISYWKDFDSSKLVGQPAVNATDLNIITSHLNHDCDSPNNP
jgi:hypothetical protein